MKSRPTLTPLSWSRWVLLPRPCRMFRVYNAQPGIFTYAGPTGTLCCMDHQRLGRLLYLAEQPRAPRRHVLLDRHRSGADHASRDDGNLCKRLTDYPGIGDRFGHRQHRSRRSAQFSICRARLATTSPSIPTTGLNGQPFPTGTNMPLYLGHYHRQRHGLRHRSKRRHPWHPLASNLARGRLACPVSAFRDP